jgi:predicted nucleic acid-binding protein
VVFADTNIVVYAYGVDPAKIAPAKAIVSAAPVISTQVINEFHNVARRKLGLDLPTRHRVATDLLQSCRVIAVDQAIVAAAMQIEARYQVSYWDALILAAALAAGCDTLFSEDMQDGQLFEGRLAVRNPFAEQ